MFCLVILRLTPLKEYTGTKQCTLDCQHGQCQLKDKIKWLLVCHWGDHHRWFRELVVKTYFNTVWPKSPLSSAHYIGDLTDPDQTIRVVSSPTNDNVFPTTHRWITYLRCRNCIMQSNRNQAHRDRQHRSKEKTMETFSDCGGNVSAEISPARSICPSPRLLDWRRQFGVHLVPFVLCNDGSRILVWFKSS